MDYGVYGGLIIIYPEPYSIYLSGAIRGNGKRSSVFFCWGPSEVKVYGLGYVQGLLEKPGLKKPLPIFRVVVHP